MRTFLKWPGHRLAVGLVVITQAAIAALSDAATAQARLDEAEKAREESARAAARGDFESARDNADRSRALVAEARSLYESMNAAESSDVVTLRGYARALSAEKDYDLAELALVRAVSIDPEEAELWLELAEAQASLGGPARERAIRSYSKAARFRPEGDANARAYAALGTVFLEMGLYDLAFENVSKALELNSDLAEAIVAMVALETRVGNMEKAAQALDEFQDVPPEFVPRLRQYLDAALRDFEDSRRWIPDTAESHFAYAKLLIRVDRLTDSYWPLLRTIRLDDQNFVAFNMMGSVLRAMKRLRGAREAFTRSLEVNPDQPRTREALQELEEEISKSPEFAPPMPDLIRIPEQTSPGPNSAGPAEGGVTTDSAPAEATTSSSTP